MVKKYKLKKNPEKTIKIEQHEKEIKNKLIYIKKKKLLEKDRRGGTKKTKKVSLIHNFLIKY